MNDLDRRVATLAALLAPERAARLLARLGTSGAAEVASHGRQLAALPRSERLRALATVLAADAAAIRASAEAAACAERARVAAVLRTLGAGLDATGAAPPLLRLCRERIGR